MRGTHGDEDRMGHEEVLDLDLDKSGAETEDFSPHLTEYLLPVYWKVSHTFHGVWTKGLNLRLLRYSPVCGQYRLEGL